MASERRFKIGDRAIAWFRDGSYTGKEVKICTDYKFTYAVEIPSSNGTFIKTAFPDELMPIDDDELDPAPAVAQTDAPAPAQPADALAALWQSTAALYYRFDAQPTHEATRRVFMEEVLEFVIEHVRYEDGNDNGDDVTEEAADVLVTVVGMLLRVTTLENLQAAIARVVAKNDSKSLDTHEVNSAGKIARKQPTR